MICRFRSPGGRDCDLDHVFRRPVRDPTRASNVYVTKERFRGGAASTRKEKSGQKRRAPQHFNFPRAQHFNLAMYGRDRAGLPGARERNLVCCPRGHNLMPSAPAGAPDVRHKVAVSHGVAAESATNPTSAPPPRASRTTTRARGSYRISSIAGPSQRTETRGPPPGPAGARP